MTIRHLGDCVPVNGRYVRCDMTGQAHTLVLTGMQDADKTPGKYYRLTIPSSRKQYFQRRLSI